MRHIRSTRVLFTAACAAALLAAACGGSSGPATGTGPATVASTPVTTAPGTTTPPTTTAPTSTAPTTTAPASTAPATTTLPSGVWTAMARSPLPKLALVTGAWDGHELLVVGTTATTEAGVTRSYGAAYDPVKDRWRTIAVPAAQTGEGGVGSVWTGRELIVWGVGLHHAYDPVTGRWRELDSPYGLGAATVWTGRLLLGWGGGCCGSSVDTGQSYDPAAGVWSPLPASPLTGRTPVAAWTGTEMVLVGGTDADGRVFADVVAYNPVTRTWRRLPSLPAPRAGATATWTGDRLVVVGGYSTYPVTDHLVSSLAVWTPGSTTWRTVSGAVFGRTGHRALWTGSRLLIWGGGAPGSDAFRPAVQGLAWVPATGRWTALPLSPLRSQPGAIVAWTGRQLLVWGGGGAVDSARFTPTVR